MKEYEKKRIEREIYEGILKIQQEEKDEITTESLSKKIHLYMEKFFKLLKSPRKTNIRKERVRLLSGEQRRKLEGLIEIGLNIIGYGIVGTFALLLLLLVSPPPFSLDIVEWMRSSIWAQVVVIMIGTGSVIYLLNDLSSLLFEGLRSVWRRSK